MSDKIDDALNELARFTSECAKEVHDVVDGQSIVVAWPDGFEEARAAAWGNTTGFAFMIRTAIVCATMKGRPTDCDRCAAAWDALKLAASALELIKGTC
jgi:hypothetical protein